MLTTHNAFAFSFAFKNLLAIPIIMADIWFEKNFYLHTYLAEHEIKNSFNSLTATIQNTTDSIMMFSSEKTFTRQKSLHREHTRRYNNVMSQFPGMSGIYTDLDRSLRDQEKNGWSTFRWTNVICWKFPCCFFKLWIIYIIWN